MQDLFVKQAIFEIPSILAKFLEIPENHVTFLKFKEDSGSNLVVNAGNYTFLMECKSSSTKASLLSALIQFEENRRASRGNVIPLLVVPFMGETGHHFCDEHKLAWLDLYGNAHIKATGLLIHVEGQPNRFKSAGRPPNIFAPKSSRIARQLLIEPDRGFTQRELSKVKGNTLLGEKANREIWVCGPDAFLVLKAMAFDKRGENKDAYDVYYVIRNYGSGIEDVYKCLKPLLDEQETQQALQILQRDFSDKLGKLK